MFTQLDAIVNKFYADTDTFITKMKNKEALSNCCGAPMNGDVCLQCFEHCQEDL